ncbi:1-acyl-sn-glycerol-3-phosphate acyltransferase [Patescibacteria group bacterium]|nr:1-acyl-sn-glycerol-3-phosphate acyltransferase [Patescibacteria group bacterium]
MLANIVVYLIVLYYRIRFARQIDLKVKGKNNIPKKGPFIIIFNHCDKYDPLYILMALPWGMYKHMSAAVASKHENHPVVKLLKNSGKAILFNREFDRNTLDEVVNSLKAGNVVGFSPEGTRSIDGSLQKAKAGILLILTKLPSGLFCPILPIGIEGSFGAEKKLKNKQKVLIKISIGGTFELQDIYDKTEEISFLQKEGREEIINRMMLRVAKLIPENLRGYYKDKIQ